MFFISDDLLSTINTITDIDDPIQPELAERYTLVRRYRDSSLRKVSI